MQLPIAFQALMQPLLKETWPQFEAAMQQPSLRGVRLQHWTNHVPLEVQHQLGTNIEWATDAYYVAAATPLPKTVYHEAGSLYFQEPSAMAVARAVKPQPGERVLDLCAAPGSKTTHLASQMPASARLVANEIHAKRVLALAENMERMGASGAVTNCDPAQLAVAWPEQFDAVLVDAPCSGEGMFRKSKSALSEWHEDTPAVCAARQKTILKSAATLLRPGGRLIYSTCTFNPIENEQIIVWLEDELGFDVQPLPDIVGWSNGRPEWADGRPSILHTKRCWPHLTEGDGHFLASLVKRSDRRGAKRPLQSNAHSLVLAPTEWRQYVEQHLQPTSVAWALAQPISQRKNTLFLDQLQDLPTTGLRILRTGTPIGVIEKGRFMPHHALSRLLPIEAFRFCLNVDETQAIHYFAGAALANQSGAKGLYVLAHAQVPLGFVKAVPGRLNNLYPKGLRKKQLISLNHDV